MWSPSAEHLPPHGGSHNQTPDQSREEMNRELRGSVRIFGSEYNKIIIIISKNESAILGEGFEF